MDYPARFQVGKVALQTLVLIKAKVTRHLVFVVSENIADLVCLSRNQGYCTYDIVDNSTPYRCILEDLVELTVVAYHRLPFKNTPKTHFCNKTALNIYCNCAPVSKTYRNTLQQADCSK